MNHGEKMKKGEEILEAIEKIVGPEVTIIALNDYAERGGCSFEELECAYKALIDRAFLAFDMHNEKIMTDQNLNSYTNKEIDGKGLIKSAYIGLEDSSGRAITGYDMAL